MHILLTDILTCPRCGPEYGLILLAESVVDRRVQEGALGCANCREKYEVRGGVVHFPGADGGVVSDEPPTGDSGGGEAALRVAALCGVTQGPGYVLLAGAAAGLAPAVAELLDGVELVAVTRPGEAVAARPGPGTNRLETAAPLPLSSARMAAVFLGGGAADGLLEEGCRVLAPLGRLVLEPAPADAGRRLETCGLRVLAQEGDTIVAVNRHAVPRTGTTRRQ